MTEHLLFLFYIFLFASSTIGHGEIFFRVFDKNLLKYNIGYIGLIGFFSISLISLISSYFFAHNFLHNIILHTIGLIGLILFLKRDKKNKKQFKYFILLTIILLVGAYLYKNHDDFPYYHLTYSLNLSENQFIIGTGAFSYGFRTFSSIFYYNSILYMPIIKFYLFHISTFFILVFFNYIILDNLHKNIKENKINFLYYFKLLSLIFINVAFYRIAEHGTDRSAQIILLLIFLYFFDLIFFEKSEKNILTKVNLILILIFMASSMKAIYYLYLLLVPIIFLNKYFLITKFIKKNLLIISILSLSLSGNLVTNYFNTGCFLYPAVKTCIGENSWSVPKKEVKNMKIHYEWWSKSGGGPNYVSEIEPKIYIKNFNWVDNWVERHFFNKVFDTLMGVIFISILVYAVFRYSSKKLKNDKLNIKKVFVAILLPLMFLIEWFLNHPAMRYGGYVLVGLPFFIFTSFMLEKLNLKKEKIYKLTVIFIIISFSLYFGRNLNRLYKEVNFYNYEIFKSPYYYVENVDFKKIFDDGKFKVYTTLDNKMCWSTKTPCSYFEKIKTHKFFGLNVVYRDVR